MPRQVAGRDNGSCHELYRVRFLDDGDESEGSSARAVRETLVWGSRALTSPGQPTSIALATWLASLIAESGATVSAVQAWPAS